MSGIDPSTISLRAKLEFLGKFSEDDFRDRVVRPLFFRLGFSDGRDLCGPMEEGMGLSLQACYLIPVDERVDLFKAVINGLAGAAHGLSRDNDYPVRGFLSYCFEGRDAVALNVLAKKIDVLKKWLGEQAIDGDERDLREFWMILGLIEAGNLGEAERLMESFKPSDPRLLLGAHLGCYLAANVRVIDAADKDAALRISKSLVGRISGLRMQVIKEFRSELLEKRRGRIEAIESPSPAQKG